MCEYPSKEYFIQEYIENNKTRKQLAEENGVSIATIKTHLYEKHITKPPTIPKDVLCQLYIDGKKTIKEIAQAIGHDRNTVARAIKSYGITKENHYSQYDDALDDEWIHLYLDERMSTFEIAKQYNCSHGTVKRHLTHCGIDVRGMSDAQRYSKGRDVLHADLSDYKTMYDMYIVNRQSLKELGEIYGCASHVIKRCLNALNIPIRDSSEAKIGVSVGSKHPNWKGGITTLCARLREYHNANLAPACRERDHYRCAMCGSSTELHSHHIIPFSEIVNRVIEQHHELDPISNVNELYDIITNDRMFLDLNNLITLCKECHLYKVHGYKKTISSQAFDENEGSTTIPGGSTSQAIGDGNGEDLAKVVI